MTNKYLKLKKKHEQQINNFKMFFAFNEEQFKEGLKELKTTQQNLISIGYGGFIKKEDIKKYNEMFKKFDEEYKKLFLDEENLFNAFIYELSNHEYSYSYEDIPVLNSLGFKDYESLTEREKKIYEKAKTKYLNSQIW